MEQREEKQKISISDLFATVTFLLFFFGIGVLLLLAPKSDFSVKEKRALQELPHLDLEDIQSGNFQQEYENYLSDHFVGRSEFVRFKTRMEAALGKKEMNGVYLGKDDYLLEEYLPEDFDADWVLGNIWCLSDFLNFMLCDYGEEHVRCMFVPSKANVLTDKLPQYADTYDTSYVVEDLRKDLSENLDMPANLDLVITDLTETLREHQEEYIYYRTDHHWTMKGAYYAYAAYQESLGLPAKGWEDFVWKQVCDNFYGTTFDKVQIAGQADSISVIETAVEPELLYYDGEKNWKTNSYYEPKALSGEDQYTYFLGGNTAEIQISTGMKNGKVLLLLKDSYSNSFVEYLAEDYERIYMIDLRYSRKDVFTIMDEIYEKDEITDILVLYNIEKFMNDNNLDLLLG